MRVRRDVVGTRPCCARPALPTLQARGAFCTPASVRAAQTSDGREQSGAPRPHSSPAFQFHSPENAHAEICAGDRRCRGASIHVQRRYPRGDRGHLQHQRARHHPDARAGRMAAALRAHPPRPADSARVRGAGANATPIGAASCAFPRLPPRIRTARHGRRRRRFVPRGMRGWRYDGAAAGRIADRPPRTPCRAGACRRGTPARAIRRIAAPARGRAALRARARSADPDGGHADAPARPRRPPTREPA